MVSPSEHQEITAWIDAKAQASAYSRDELTRLAWRYPDISLLEFIVSMWDTGFRGAPEALVEVCYDLSSIKRAGTRG